MRHRPGTLSATAGKILIAAACLMAAAGVAAQQFDEGLNLSAGRHRFERPAALSVSPTGEQIAISDPTLGRIGVVDYRGRPLWSVGDQVNLDQPLAVCFLPDNELLFSLASSHLILKISRDNPTVLDTVTDLDAWFRKDQHADGIIAARDGRYLVLDKSGGRILRFDKDWKFVDIPIKSGSGKGRTLAPTALSVLPDGRMVVTDRKNYPAQMFGPDGSVLFNFGWNTPAEERGWEAVAVAIDSRQVIWIADETNDMFRLFDAAGTQVSTVPFPSPLFRPIALTGTIDNRMLVIDDRGEAVYYTLQ